MKEILEAVMRQAKRAGSRSGLRQRRLGTDGLLQRSPAGKVSLRADQREPHQLRVGNVGVAPVPRLTFLIRIARLSRSHG